jgi:O-antigen ligase
LLPVVEPLNIKLSGLVVQPADIIFVGAALMWVVALAGKRAKIRWSWFYLPLALYLGALVVSTLASENLRFSALKLLGEIYLLGLAVLTFNLVTSMAALRRVAAAWSTGTAITVIAGVLGILLFYAGVRDRSINIALHGYGSLPPGNYPRIDALFLYAAMLCNYLSVSFMIAVLMRSLGWRRSYWFRLLLPGIWITAFFTLTPGLGGLALSAGLWAWLRSKETAHRRAGQLALIGGCAIALAFFISAAVKLFSTDRQLAPVAERRLMASHRANAWRTAYETFIKHPLSGRGVGMDVAASFYVTPSGHAELLTDAHNTWLSIAGQTGFIGLLAFTSLVLYLLKGLGPLRISGQPGATIKTCLTIAFIDAFLYQSLTGSFEDMRHIWVLIGMLAAAREGFDKLGNN